MPEIKNPDVMSCKVFVTQAVLDKMKRHGDSHTDYEICGVMVGNLCFTPENEWIVCIDDSIEGKYADNKAGAVTFTSATWGFIHDTLANDFPHKRIVGWYHTHPSFGIFLSEMDTYIHKNFFSPRWQVAYVYDPVQFQDGWFIWKENELLKTPVIIVPNSAMPQEKDIILLSQSVLGEASSERPEHITIDNSAVFNSEEESMPTPTPQSKSSFFETLSTILLFFALMGILFMIIALQCEIRGMRDEFSALQDTVQYHERQLAEKGITDVEAFKKQIIDDVFKRNPIPSEDSPHENSECNTSSDTDTQQSSGGKKGSNGNADCAGIPNTPQSVSQDAPENTKQNTPPNTVSKQNQKSSQ